MDSVLDMQIKLIFLIGGPQITLSDIDKLVPNLETLKLYIMLTTRLFFNSWKTAPTKCFKILVCTLMI